MCKIRLLLTFMLLSNTATAQVDFSRAYVVPDAAAPDTLHLNGIATHVDNMTLLNSLHLGFDADNTRFVILEATPQSANDSILLQQNLRGTHWVGDYRSATNLYLTDLTLRTVQNGFIAGEILHRTAEQPEAKNLLRADVVGSISTEFLILREDETESVWVNANDLSAETVPFKILDNRHHILLKRLRALEFRHASSRWGSTAEYDLLLEGNRLSGNIGTPPDSFGSNTGNSSNGAIDLVLFVPVQASTKTIKTLYTPEKTDLSSQPLALTTITDYSFNSTAALADKLRIKELSMWITTIKFLSLTFASYIMVRGWAETEINARIKAIVR